jgi:uroporphyrinogen decarboxylase
MMSITSREIVQMSLSFASPPRIPYGMGGGFPSDLRGVSRKPAPNRKQQDWVQHDGYQNRIDEWGNEWRRIEQITSGEVYRGVIEESWDLLESYDFPNVDLPELYEEATESTAKSHEEGYYVIGHLNWPFNTARYMRRLEVFLADCVTEPDRVRQLLKGVTDTLESEIHRLADAGVDAIMTCEDWGTQDRLLVSPTMFRDLFKPTFKQLCGAAHSRGLHVWLHSCGWVRDVIEDWIEVGVDVCQFDQPELHDIDFLAEQFGGRMHFYSPVDIQTTLQTQDRSTIEAAAKRYIDTLAAPFGGGFIAGYYGSNDALGVPLECQAAACEAFMKYGDLSSHTATGGRT